MPIHSIPVFCYFNPLKLHLTWNCSVLLHYSHLQIPPHLEDIMLSFVYAKKGKQGNMNSLIYRCSDLLCQTASD